MLASFPAGTRLICRRERPHPGAQLSLFDHVNGMRHQVFATDTPARRRLDPVPRSPAPLPRPRRGPHPHRQNHRLRPVPVTAVRDQPAWLELALTGIDLLSWTQHLLLDGPLGRAEPKKLRYRLLHVAAKLTRTARTTTLRIAAGWPWTDDLIRAFQRLAELPEPVT